MTVPSTEELQRLLDEATPGEWKWDDTVRRSLYSKDAEGKGREIIKCAALLYPDEPDAEIIALAPVLAAEVIRLREEIEALRDECRRYPTSRGHFYADRELTRILEGDQA